VIPVIEATIRLAELRRSDRTEDNDAYPEEMRPAAQELLAHLEGLPPSDARRLLALMYFGRGDDADLLRLEEELIHDEDDAIFSMFEKVPLPEYLRNGVTRAGQLGIDLEAWWRGELTRPADSEAPRAIYEGPTFSCWNPELDPIKHGGEIFANLAAEWPGDTIPKADVDRFFTQLKTRTGGHLIVDFIDLADWDCLAGHEFASASDSLMLYWHDFRATKEWGMEMVFPADLYGLYIHLQEIKIVRTKDLAAFLLKGFATTPNQAKKRLREGADEIGLFDENLFSTRVVRRVNGMHHVIDVHGAPLYTIALIPKGQRIPSGASRRLLFRANVHTLFTRLQDVGKALTTVADPDHDLICEKANTVRRILEQALKIELIFRDIPAKKPYGQLTLGDLTGLLYPHHELPLRQALGKAAELANELSHDSGAVIELQKATQLVAIAISYLQLLDLDTSAEFTH
jgi:hypothetical protein